MESLDLEHDLRQMFIEYGPYKVMMTWNKVLQEFREMLLLHDTKQEPKTIIFKNTIETPQPKKEPVVSIVPDNKDVQKEKMRVHKEVIQKRRQELAAQGIIPETQLTEENLKKWIQQEHKNYWTIAEETGCNDMDISNIARSKNILSEVAMMIRKKRAKL